MNQTTDSKPISRILHLFSSKRKRISFLLLLVTCATAFDLAIPFISQKLLDTMIRFFKGEIQAPTHVLTLSAIGILVATLLNRVIKSWYDYRLFTTVTSFEDEMRTKSFEKYVSLHALFHHGSHSGQIIGQIDRGATAIFSIVFDIVGQRFVPSLLAFLGVSIALLLKSPLIALVVFLPFPLYLAAVIPLTKKIYRIEKQSNERFEELNKQSYDIAGNVHTVKKFAQEAREVALHRKLQLRSREIQYQGERLWAIIENIQTAIATLGRIAVIVVGGLLTLNGKATIGEFVLFVTLQNIAYVPLSNLSILFPRLRRNSARLERLFNVLDEENRVIEIENARTLKPLERSIVFSNVWFRYPTAKRWALTRLNITIPKGTTVALVGKSGSGKTTFINLLMRSFDPTKGSIAIDGTNIKYATFKSLRGQMAVVPQETDLFSRTIAQNIAYGSPSSNLNKVQKAAKGSFAHEFIKLLPKGYQTLVGERGVKLSGGERQRISIARALLKDPEILILDEATSHLDSESEQAIQKATHELIHGKTAFIIAHRLSTVLNADMIIVFRNGSLEAHGNHRELLKTSRTYRTLYKLQFKDTHSKDT